MLLPAVPPTGIAVGVPVQRIAEVNIAGKLPLGHVEAPFDGQGSRLAGGDIGLAIPIRLSPRDDHGACGNSCHRCVIQASPA